MEKFTYFWVVFTSDGRKNRELDIRIGKANAVLRELYRAVIKTGYFQLPQNFTFQIGLCSDPRLWSWILVTTERVLSQLRYKQRRAICLKIVRRHTSRWSAQLWNLWKRECRINSTQKIPSRMVRSCDKNIPGKIGEAIPAGYTQGKAAQRPTEDQWRMNRGLSQGEKLSWKGPTSQHSEKNYSETLNHRNWSGKRKINNLLKTKSILKPKYKVSGRSVFTFRSASCKLHHCRRPQVVWLHLWPCFVSS